MFPVMVSRRRLKSFLTGLALYTMAAGMVGYFGVNAAKTLQNVLPGISGPIMGQPETYLNAVGDAFDDKGNLIKESLQKVLQQFIDAFAAFVEKQNKS